MQPKTFLFVMWEGGGSIPPILGLAHRMVLRGNRVKLITLLKGFKFFWIR